jgi:lipoprotein-anchoring transpeptidase ErfK/SrfK
MARKFADDFGKALRLAQTVMFAGACIPAVTLFSSNTSAQVMEYASPAQNSLLSEHGVRVSIAARPADDADVSRGSERMRRTIVAFSGREAPGTVVIDTDNTFLYYVLRPGLAVRYGVGVGREGFTWSGVQAISRKAEWPDWHPPTEMIARQPYLPRFMAGGPGNPLGARALYLGSSVYRIHGTNDPSTIGKFVSSGCIRLTNEDISDLFSRVSVGTRVVVLPKAQPIAAGRAPMRSQPLTRIQGGQVTGLLTSSL